jgi:hypothetical protein
MMEDGLVKPEQDHGWAEDRHDIEENGGRREGGIVRRTDTKVVQGLV